MGMDSGDSFYVTQMPLRYIIMQGLFQIMRSDDLCERHRIAMYIYSIFWPQLKKELDEAVRRNLAENKPNLRRYTDRDLIIYGVRRVEEMKTMQRRRILEAEINAICKAVVEVMEKHNLIETPYRSLGEIEL